MSEQTLRFWREVEPTPGPVALRFGNYLPLVKLRFSHPVQATPGPVNLVFGAYIPPLFDTITATLAATLPAAELSGLTLVAEGEQAVATVYADATLAATLPPAELPGLTLVAIDATLSLTLAATLPAVDVSYMVLTADFVQNLDLPDADGVGIRDRSTRHPTTHAALTVRSQEMIRTPTPLAAHQQQALPLAASLAVQQQSMIASRSAAHVPHTHGIALSAHTRPRHAEALRTRRRKANRHQHGIPATAGTGLAHAECIRIRRPTALAEQQALPTASGTSIGHQHGRKTATRLSVRQQQMIPLPVGWWQATYPWPPPWIDPNAPSSPVTLRFCRMADGTTRLVFGCPPPVAPPANIVIPVRRTYIVINNVTLMRVAGGVPIPAGTVSVSFDCDSWLPSFSANLPASALDLVMPDPNPVEVAVTINTIEFRFLVERVQRSRDFSSRSISISGRGVACELDAPYAPVSTFNYAADRTAQQLIDDALQFTGYTQDWQISDWLVPANTYSLTGTPAAVATDVAEASGSVLAAHWNQRVLRMLPRYPVKPWDWAAAVPDISIPSAVVQTESLEWLEKPAYNAVYVSGTTAGVIGQVKITGTAGDNPAQMVTHPLITHADAARQRGVSILSDTGRKAMMQISLPVLPESGVIDVCKLIEFADGANTRRGIVRANQISVDWPRVRQTLTVEAAA